MELDVNGSAGWLESEELDVLLLPLLVAMQRKLPTEVLCTDEAACAQRCAKAFLAVKVSIQHSSAAQPLLSVRSQPWHRASASGQGLS